MTHKITLYWVTHDAGIKKKIRSHFTLSAYESVSGEQPAEIPDELWSDMLATQKAGYIQIRNSYEKWLKNGEVSDCKTCQ